MPFRLIFHPGTHIDIDNALSWYDSIDPALAIRFESELLTCYEKITLSPQHYFILHKKLKIRRISLKRFPYKLVFQIQENNTVWIITLMHLKQRPTNWKKRLQA